MDVMFSCQKRMTRLQQIFLQPMRTFLLRRFTRRNNYRIYSVFPHGGFERIPQSKLEGLSCGVCENARYSAGKTITFSTDANFIDLLVTYERQDLFNNMDVRMSSGLDVYGVLAEGGLEWLCCLAPKSTSRLWAEGRIEHGNRFSSLLIVLPSYAAIEEIMLRVEKKFSVTIEEKTSNVDILFYGSSITQGCAASRSGLNYVNQVALKLGCRIANYGFSSSAKGEEEIAQLIAHEHASVYVIEYDHNATVDELKKTHQRFYEIVRAENPSSFIIFLSRISAGISISQDEYEERDKIIRETVDYAARQGDGNVCYIPGDKIAPTNERSLFVDDRHPNDRGMSLIADQIIGVIGERWSMQRK